MENEQKGNSFGAGVSLSTEFDYKSYGANISYSKKSRNKNAEFSAAFQAYFDQVSLVNPVELRTNNNNNHEQHYGTSARNSFNGSLSYSQIINERLQVMFLVDAVLQQGYLGLPFHRVYLVDSTLRQENLPGKRLKIPLGFRASYFLGDKIIIKAYYRFYTDDWGLTAHTGNIELPVKLNAFFSISPFYRLYSQTGVKYFNAYRKHDIQETYYTSNYDLSRFSSNFFGAGFRFEPAKGIFGIKHFNMLELRYGHYTKNVGMNADIISMNLRFR